MNLVFDLEEGKEKIEAWRGHHDGQGPHRSWIINSPCSISRGAPHEPRSLTLWGDVEGQGGKPKGGTHQALSTSTPPSTLRLLASQTLSSGRTGRR